MMGDSLNKLLLRQIRRHFGSIDQLPEGIGGFIQDVSSTYANFEDDFKLLQNSIEISSQELRDSLLKQKQDAEAQKTTIDNIKGAIYALNPTENKRFNEDETANSDSSYLFDSLLKLIEERNQAEEEILKLWKAVEQNPASIVITDINGDIEYVNPKFCNLTGYKKEEAIGNNPRILKTDDTPREHFTNLWNTILAGKEWQGELQNKKKNGELYWESALISPIINENKVITHFIAIKEDITERKKAEVERIRQSGLITSLLDSIPDIIFFKDTAGKYLGCNIPFAEFVGMPKSDIVGKSDFDLFDKETANSFVHFDAEMLRLKLPRHNEEWITYPDGRKVMLDTLKTPYWASDGTLIGILGISRDITARKESEDQLKDSESFQRSLLENVSVGIVIIDPETRRIELVNTFASLLIGESPENIVGRKCHHYICPANENSCPVCDKDLVVDSSERTLLRTNDLPLTILKTVKEILIGGKKKLLESFVDISVQKDAEAALLQSSKKWEAIIAASPDGIGMVSLDGKLQLMSDKLAAIYGFTVDQKEKYVDKTVFDFIDPSNHQLLSENIENLIAGENDKRITEYLAVREDGSQFYVDVNSTVLFDADGQPESMLFVERDITSRKQAEESLQNERTLFRTIIDLIPDAVYVKDIDGKKIIANPKEVQFA